MDVATGVTVKYGELEDLSRRVASGLRRLGLQGRGDVLYFVTYEMSHLFIVMLAAWRLGATVRGCYQKEQPGETTCSPADVMVRPSWCVF